MWVPSCNADDLTHMPQITKALVMRNHSLEDVFLNQLLSWLSNSSMGVSLRETPNSRLTHRVRQEKLQRRE
jgi:hypothetical protein